MAHDLPTIAFICIRNYAIIATRFPAPKCMLQIRQSRCGNGRAKEQGGSLSHNWFAILSVVRNYWFITRRHSGCGSLDDSDSWVKRMGLTQNINGMAIHFDFLVRNIFINIQNIILYFIWDNICPLCCRVFDYTVRIIEVLGIYAAYQPSICG